MRHVSKEQVQKLIGRNVYVQRKDGSVIAGKLERLQGERLYIRTAKAGSKSVNTRGFILPLVLFDLLAIGTLPYAGFGGGYGCPGPQYGPCGGVGPYGKPVPYGPGPGGYAGYGGYPPYGPRG